MSETKSSEIKLTDPVREILERITRCYTKPHDLVQRAKMILMAAAGAKNIEIARSLDSNRNTVYTWRIRWLANDTELRVAEDAGIDEYKLTEMIETILSDAYRSGAPDTFEPEQLVQIVAIACEPPHASDREITNWTHRELADEAIKRTVVDTISPRHVGRILKEADLKPHRSRYWLNANPDDPETFAAEVKNVCDLHLQAQALHQQGISLVSTDEKTGIQALERKHPTKPAKPGFVERREFEYERHGTQCLIANFHIATGKIIGPSLGLTRTEDDFLNHIAQTVDTNPTGEWIFIVDQLNTHMSESLVKFVINRCSLEIDEDIWGVKGQSGVLKSMPTRKTFLENVNHRSRFVYTPKHTSWLNQVEIWFSILVRKLLKRASFISVDDLRQRILNFIDYFNATRAKPFKWTYTGRPLTT